MAFRRHVARTGPNWTREGRTSPFIFHLVGTVLFGRARVGVSVSLRMFRVRHNLHNDYLCMRTVNVESHQEVEKGSIAAEESVCTWHISHFSSTNIPGRNRIVVPSRA